MSERKARNGRVGLGLVPQRELVGVHNHDHDEVGPAQLLLEFPETGFKEVGPDRVVTDDDDDPDDGGGVGL